MVESMQQSNWQKWCLLAPWERRFLLRAWFKLLVVKFRLYFSSSLLYTKGCGNETGKPPVLIHEMNALAFALRCQELIAIASRKLPVSMTCLPQALVLKEELMGYGLAATLKIGVAAVVNPFTAHAWVEYEGVKLDAHEVSYHAFDGLR